ncbi:SAF domain protein [Posidoniimonas polymericola]|uniref:SAF domain protein n=1 Tax=Posidoniimonas polymericola TaxID=2528002 RepID=A0A5C5YPG4_9BACT|nr:Flp pilus assembly protein CpaB [Posidoniimonas polymericola]TWT76852.1 SAF domain protein [Posidoniimonas polymericola]
MRPKSLILLALALGCGLVASIGISQVMEGNKSRGPSVETTSIYVALHNINLGDPIDATMISLQEWPKDKVPPGALTSLEDLEGRRPRTNIIAGEPILDAKLLAQGEQADPLSSVPPNMRLSTISVDAEKSAAGLLSPGDRVDIQLFVRADPRNGISEAATKIFLQNIRVFAIEQAVQRSGDGEARTIPKTVSLLVTPEQATKIDFAQHIGELSLIPRNPNDEGLAMDSAINFDQLFDGAVEKNDREKEQARDETAVEEGPKGSFLGGVLSMMKRTAKERPPFEIEIVMADEVSVEYFDANTGKPLRDYNDKRNSSDSGGSGSGGASSAADDAPSMEDFPIEFDGE